MLINGTYNRRRFYSQIINVKTIDLVLNCVMNEGLRINSGERLGKTIIFAANHKHAQAIVDRFNEIHPEYGENYCQLIDNKVKYADSIIASCIAELPPPMTATCLPA